MSAARPAAEQAVEVDRPTRRWVDDGQDQWTEQYDEVPGMTGDVDTDQCQVPGCTEYVGWLLTSSEDEYGAEHEHASWYAPWRLPDGRLVCESCASAWDEGHDLARVPA